MPVKILKFLLPLVVIAAGGIAGYVIIKSRKPVESKPSPPPKPLVRSQIVRRADLPLKVSAHGKVRPRTETTLVPQVTGRILDVAPSFADGGFFKKDEALVRIDVTDYEFALARAKLAVAQADLRLKREIQEAELARAEWEKFGKGEADPLVLRKPQLEEARAALAAAQADVNQAKLNIQRSELKAPFDGRIRKKFVDLGQFVTAGTPVAQIYAVDYAEVRIPIPDRELAFLDLPLDYRDVGEEKGRKPIAATVHATFAGKDHAWHGTIVRTEAEIDPRTRMVHAVARVDNPYDRGGNPDRPPLAVGMFVLVEIDGRTATDVFVVPRGAVRDPDQILVIDDRNRLHFRTIDILRTESTRVIVRGGLKDGERICLSPLAVAVDNMEVRVTEEETRR